MIDTVRKISGLLDPRERRQALKVMLVIILMAFIEVLGIASILPFMAVLSAPETVQSNEWLNWLYIHFNFQSINQYLFFLGISVLIVLVISNIIKGFSRWVTLHYSQMSGYTISQRLFFQYMHQPYVFFLQRNSNDLSKNVLAEVNSLTNNILMTSMDLCARILVSLSILALLIFIDPILAFVSFMVLGGAYGAIYLTIRRVLMREGDERLKAQGTRYKLVNEAFQGIKNIKLTGHEETYANLYDKPVKTYAKTTALASALGELPRFALEIIAFGGILLIILYLLLKNAELNTALPLITLYAFAGYRLMPNLQLIFQGFTRLNFYGVVLDNISRELEGTAQSLQRAPENDTTALPFEKKIAVRDVSFEYPSLDRPVLKNISLDISARSVIGIAGKTGSGKTTLVDIIVGLIDPSSGSLMIDGTILNDDTRRAWQKNTAYVTQHIYLSDDTIRRNIAFGEIEENIDDARIKKAARMACIADFIETDLPEAYETYIGENGIRLSGGQRQRIGLARALYLDRPLLVLDEATSALDPATEEAVIRNIHEDSHDRTIIMITHRLLSLRNCNMVYLIENGRIAGQDHYDALWADNPKFRNLGQLSP